ncbi:MAG: TonB-dependent receptor, partial [Myxococcota bacterium]
MRLPQLFLCCTLLITSLSSTALAQPMAPEPKPGPINDPIDDDTIDDDTIDDDTIDDDTIDDEPIGDEPIDNEPIDDSPIDDVEPADEDDTLVIDVEGEALKDPPGRFAAGEWVDTYEARGQSGDMGAVLNRSRGVLVRRSGGLGEPVQLSIHGLSGSRVRVFIDGVPSELLGFGFGVATIPVEFIDWIELHKGVVPIAYGTDALGGALNMVTRRDSEDAAHLSYQVASFGTRRASALAKTHLSEPRKLYVAVRAFHDTSDNDFEVELPVINDQGREQLTRLPLFHNTYRAWSLQTELGVTEQSWADTARIWVTTSRQERDLQSDPLRVFPYGDAGYEELTQGVWGLWQRDWKAVSGELLLGVSQRERTLRDVSYNRYDWRGEIIATRRNPGEFTDGLVLRIEELQPRVRLNTAWRPRPEHSLELNVTPSYTWRNDTGRSTLLNDESTTSNEAGTLVVGLAHRWRPEALNLDQTLFVKGYGLRTQGSAGPLINSDGEQEPVSATRRTLGVGDGLLWSPFSWFSVRASYEWATRLPEADELFGNGQLIQPNLELRPERSHNANLATLWSIPLGDDASLDAEVQGFVRSTEDLIFLVNYGLTSNYENIAAVDTRGLEVGMNLRPATWASVGGNLTWLDARNRSLEGQFARFDGERIPNMPYLTGNVHTTLTMRPGSHLVQGYTYGRYVHEFF